MLIKCLNIKLLLIQATTGTEKESQEPVNYACFPLLTCENILPSFSSLLCTHSMEVSSYSSLSHLFPQSEIYTVSSHVSSLFCQLIHFIWRCWILRYSSMRILNPPLTSSSILHRLLSMDPFLSPTSTEIIPLCIWIPILEPSRESMLICGENSQDGRRRNWYLRRERYTVRDDYRLAGQISIEVDTLLILWQASSMGYSDGCRMELLMEYRRISLTGLNEMAWMFSQYNKLS